ncbi:MAG: glycogen/starch synthase [Bacteroidetes bacterium]|nr:glycogen/starch synthase [Bacteroidota bacterium]
MEKKRLLIVTPELQPYNELSDIANLITSLPNQLAALDYDIRILMPKFGTINERRHKLHEVVRLSGINVVFNDEDFPMMIKVASLPGSKYRLQIYFLDNDEFFKRKSDFHHEDGTFFEANGDRSIFFNRGVLDTVKKFGWAQMWFYATDGLQAYCQCISKLCIVLIHFLQIHKLFTLSTIKHLMAKSATITIIKHCWTTTLKRTTSHHMALLTIRDSIWAQFTSLMVSSSQETISKKK